MSTTVRLAEAIYMEVFGDKVVRLIEAESAVPVVWSHSISITDEDQTTLAIHLLFGFSESASKNRSVGHWRISKIPLFVRGIPDIDIEIHIDEDGKVVVAASVGGWPLKVRPIGRINRVPVEGSTNSDVD